MKRKKLQKPILAEGESTGHCHQFTKNIDVFETVLGEREFTLTKPVDLAHPEHLTIEIPKGDFVSDRGVEYDPFLAEARKIRD